MDLAGADLEVDATQDLCTRGADVQALDLEQGSAGHGDKPREPRHLFALWR
jgi:hypothetical protein